MQFEVKMRDGSSQRLDATYIEVTDGPVSTYTLLGPVPNHPIAILAAFPVDLVRSVCRSDASQERSPGEIRGSRRTPALTSAHAGLLQKS